MKPRLFYRFFLITAFSLLLLLPATGVFALSAPGTVRVALVRQADSLSFKTSGIYQLIDRSTGRVMVDLKQGESWQVRISGGGIELQGRQQHLGPFIGPVVVREAGLRAVIVSGSGDRVERYSTDGLAVLNGLGKTDLLSTAGLPVVKGAGGTASLSGGGGLNLVTLADGAGAKRYRGSLEFQVEEGKLTAVNELNIEDYLRGVVPAEMPSAWPAEALKAQAVAARNYALQREQASRGRPYGLTGDQYSQVYRGYDAETPATNRAVEETRGIVMISGGSLISAFFHSSSGGYTENCEDVWLNALTYIKCKEDPFDQNDRHYNWQVRYTASQLAEQLKAAGYQFSEVEDIQEVARTSSGARVEKILVRGKGPSGEDLRAEISNADRVRIALGLKSALFTLDKAYDKDKNLASVTITGSGWGHGLGLSQWGAHGMASRGYKYNDILQYYYSGINIAADYGRSPSPHWPASGTAGTAGTTEAPGASSGTPGKTGTAGPAPWLR